MDYEGHWLYKEICSMSRELRYSIRHMPVEYRYDIGKLKDIENIDEHVVASINSYLGLLGHYSTYHIRKKMVEHLPNLVFGKGYRKVKLAC